MKRRKILTLLLTLSLLISLCAAFSVSASAAGTTRTETLALSDTTSDANAAEGWTWDADTSTLTLDSVTIDTDDYTGLYIENTSGGNLHATIVLKGENTISSNGMSNPGDTSYGIYVDGSCTIIGDAGSSLDVYSADSFGAGFSFGILTEDDMTFNSNGRIGVISGVAENSVAVFSRGAISFASGSVLMMGDSNACQANMRILVASNLVSTGSTDYLASNESAATVEVFNNLIESFAVNGTVAKTVRITPKQPEQKPTTDKKNDNGNTLNELLPAILGTLSKEDSTMPFTDVKASDWYYNSVYGAWENKLIDGATKTLFKPNDTLTVAQAIKLSAALHQLNKTGSVTLTNGTPWYRSYVDYAVTNGIIEKAYSDYTAEQLNAPASRSEFVHIFFGAMSDYAALNMVADGKIPDVKMSDKNAKEIYTFYRAGILTGSDSSGTFNAASTIKRSEAAAILNRMFDASERQTITLK